MRDLVKSKKTEGFTIIEVMIVLAIAGLIMVIVFLAVPQLQRNQRDNARQSVANRVKAELETYAGNNQGQYPFNNTAGTVPTTWLNCTGMGTSGTTGACGDWYARYINNGTQIVNINDPTTGQLTTINVSNSLTLPPWVIGNMYIAVGAKCNGENIQAGAGAGGSNNAREYAVVINLDRTNTRYCVDNG